MFLSLFLFVILFTPQSLFSQGFLAGALIKVPHGYETIEKINPDDFVISFDGAGKAMPCKVNSVCWEDVQQVVKLTINDEVIFAAPEHKFYSVHDQQWIFAKDINTSSKLLQIIPVQSNADDSCLVKVAYVCVQSAETINQNSRIYCMDVDGCPNFCITKSHLVVHNEWNWFTDKLIEGFNALKKLIFNNSAIPQINNAGLSANKLMNLNNIVGNNNVVSSGLNSCTPLAIAVIGGAILLFAAMKVVEKVIDSKKDHHSNNPGSGSGNGGNDSPNRSLPGFGVSDSSIKDNSNNNNTPCNENQFWRTAQNNVFKFKNATDNQCGKMISVNGNTGFSEMFFGKAANKDFICINITDKSIVDTMKSLSKKKDDERNGFFAGMVEGFKGLTMPLRKLLKNPGAKVVVGTGMSLLGGSIIPLFFSCGKNLYDAIYEEQSTINSPPPLEDVSYQAIGKNTGMFLDDSGRFWVRSQEYYATWTAFNYSGKKVMVVNSQGHCTKFN